MVYWQTATQGARWPHGQSARRAIAEAKQRKSQSLDGYQKLLF
jgi:hypothetical protein